MSQQTGRISAQAGVTNEISDVYAAGAQMFNELFSFPTGGELLGVPPPKNEGVPGSKLNSNNDWRVLNGQQQYDYCGGFNTQKEGNTNMQSLEAIPLYLLNPAYGGNYTAPAISFASNTATDYHQSSQNNSIQFQLPVFPQSMPNQDLCNVEQVPSKESWPSGGAANELLLLPTGNGGNLLNNNLQFAPPQQLNHTVNWANSSLQHCTSQRCEQSPMETNFRSQDERSVQGLSLSLSSNSQVQVQPFETSRLISSQDMVNRFQTTADAKNKSVDVLNGSKVGFLPPFSRSETIFPPKHSWNPNNSSTRQFQGHMMQSRYMKPTRQLLDEFCSMAEGGAKYNIYGAPKQKRQKSEQEISFGGHNKNQSITQSGLKFEPSVSISDTATGIIGNESVNGNGNKNRLNFSGDRFDLRRRKAKLLWMLDELVRRHRQYREQMKMVAISFESAVGVGAATTYTSLTAKAMSRHFKCLKDAITGQIKATNDALGDNESSIPGITKGETPRLKMIEQSLRHQRGFQRVGMLEQDAWRPQRGLPERALTFLRAWLFEHFLHPYPSDADKHLLARQTGLSRSQVSNWFINARVRLWKPMVEEMYQEEAKEAELEEEDANSNHNNHEKNTLDSSGVTISLSPESQDCNNFIGNTCREEELAAMQRENTLEHNENEVHGACVGGLDFSSYNDNGTRNNSGRMFPQQNITSTYFGSGDVSLTLGLRQTAHQEKYHNALCLPC